MTQKPQFKHSNLTEMLSGRTSTPAFLLRSDAHSRFFISIVIYLFLNFFHPGTALVTVPAAFARIAYIKFLKALTHYPYMRNKKKIKSMLAE